MNKDSFGNWYYGGGFPSGTFNFWPEHLRETAWPDDVRGRAQRLRDERDVVG